MKKFLYLVLLFPAVVMSQELDSLSTDSVEIVVPKNIIGAYVLVGLNLTPNPGGLNGMNTVAVGARYNKFEAGFTYSSFGGSIESRLVFPNSFRLVYAHGGGFISYSLMESEWIGLAAMGTFQRGDMVWERLDTNEDFLREKFSLWQLGLRVEMPKLRFLRPGVIFGYQNVPKVNIAGVTKEDFTGFFVGFTVKVGYFNQ